MGSCPKAWQASFRGVKGTCIILKPPFRTTYGFGMHFLDAGEHERHQCFTTLTLFHSMINDTSPSFEYQVSGNTYSVPYWLADGFYPNWPVFMKSILIHKDQLRNILPCYKNLAGKTLRGDLASSRLDSPLSRTLHGACPERS